MFDHDFEKSRFRLASTISIGLQSLARNVAASEIKIRKFERYDIREHRSYLMVCR